jgi:hypothetical protein
MKTLTAAMLRHSIEATGPSEHISTSQSTPNKTKRWPTTCHDWRDYSSCGFQGSASLLIHQVANNEVPSPKKFNKTTPRDLETICMKCLSKEADSRYESAEQLQSDLRCFLDYQPIIARRSSILERTVRWLSRRRRFVANNLLFLLFGIGVATTWYCYAKLSTATIEFTTKTNEPIAVNVVNNRGHRVTRFTIPTAFADRSSLR